MATIPYDEIEDESLRSELQQLGIKIPHAQSVLDPTLGQYDTPFYHKLLAMEAYTYDNTEQPQATPEDYSPFWEEFNTSLMSYVTHEPLSTQTIKNVVSGLFGFLNVHYGHGAGSEETIVNSNAKSIFVMNGFIETTLQRPIDFYDDLIPEDPMALPEPVEASAERLEAEPEIVGSAWAGDAGKVDALLSQYSDAISDVAVNAMFGNVDPDAKGPTQVETWDLVFIDLNWKWFIEEFGSSFKIPPRPPE